MTTAPTTTAPAAGTTPAAVTPAPKPTGRASDHIAAALAQEQAGTVGTGQTPETPATAAAAPQAPAKVEPTKEEAEADRRLSKLAAERRRFEEDKKAHAAKLAETERKAALWDKLEAAKTGGTAMDVLTQLWKAEEIETRVYNELAADILARTPSDEPLTPAQVEEMVQARLDAEKKDTEKKAQEAAAERAKVARTGYLKGVNDAFDAEKYPLVAEFQIQPHELLGEKDAEGKVAKPGFVDTYFAEHDELPTPEQIFEHFEAQHRARYAKVTGAAPAAPAAGVPGMVTSKLAAAATPETPDLNAMTKEQRWAWAKKQAGITAGA